jgi:predicted small lipoprotein YifL
MQKHTKKMLLLLATSLILSACGTKGPLYIPEQQYPQPTKATK